MEVGLMGRFIVGTGRCGSTLLSRMLAENTGVMSIFEFFTGLDMLRRFSNDPVSGDSIADLVSSEQPMVTAVLRRGYSVEEITYPFSDDESCVAEEKGARRYRRSDALPWILVSTLGRLTPDPDTLFDEVMDKIRNQPLQPANAHFGELFGWLTKRFGREVWIERSGSSIDYFAGLVDQYPEARFLHLHRDGHEVALSMRGHHAYRLPISLIYNARLANGKRVSELGAIDVHAAPTGDDPISQILSSLPAPAEFGRYWNDQLLHGFPAIVKLDAAQYMDVCFEDLVTRPKEVIRTISDFFELPNGDPDWIDRAAAIVTGTPATRFDDLPEHDRDALKAECRTGQVLLGRGV
jgi:hypothetical protein